MAISTASCPQERYLPLPKTPKGTILASVLFAGAWGVLYTLARLHKTPIRDRINDRV
jgi:hypothetical protein